MVINWSCFAKPMGIQNLNLDKPGLAFFQADDGF